jgi:hypothetical protein
VVLRVPAPALPVSALAMAALRLLKRWSDDW